MLWPQFRDQITWNLSRVGFGGIVVNGLILRVIILKHNYAFRQRRGALCWELAVLCRPIQTRNCLSIPWFLPCYYMHTVARCCRSRDLTGLSRRRCHLGQACDLPRVFPIRVAFVTTEDTRVQPKRRNSCEGECLIAHACGSHPSLRVPHKASNRKLSG